MSAAEQLQHSAGIQAALALAEALGRRVELTEQLTMAIERVDPAGVQTLLAQVQAAARAVNAAGEHLPEIDKALPPTGEIRTLLSRLAEGAQAADQRLVAALHKSGFDRLNDWLASPPVSDAEHLRALLAEPWDLRHDVVVLLGEGASRLVAPLAAAGQKRIFCQAKEGEALKDAIPIRRMEDFDPAAWTFALPAPNQFRLRVLGPRPIDPQKAIERLQESLINVGKFSHAVQTQATQFLAHSGRNLAQIPSHPSAARVVDLFKGVPAVVVAAGPSLDKNIHLLKELKGHAVIFCINQTVKALRKAGIQPDVVVACDYQNLAYQFEGVQPGEIPALALGASVSPDLFKLPAERIFTVATSPIIESWIYQTLGEEASVRATGTVATSALQLAVKMGCTPIATIGFDFALAGRKYYANNAADGGKELSASADGKLTLTALESKLQLVSDEEKEKVRESLSKPVDLVEIPGYFGTPVMTTPNMRAQILALRAQIPELTGKVTLINATEGGAYVEGMEHRPLAEFVEMARPTAVDAPGRLAAALELKDASARRARMRARLEEVCDDLQKAMTLASRCRKTFSKHGGADAQTLDKLKKVGRRLPFLSVMISKQIVNVEYAAAENKDMDDLDSAESAIYQAIEVEGARLLPILEEALGELKKG